MTTENSSTTGPIKLDFEQRQKANRLIEVTGVDEEVAFETIALQDALLGQQVRLEADCATASAVLKTFPRLANGLTPDVVRNSPERREAKARYDVAFRRLQSFNQQYARILRRSL